MKKTIGILAHVDAGKTTFSEQLLFHTKSIKQLGRVDHQSAFLDHHQIERQRGITVFAEQAIFQYMNNTYYLIDTPGHVDFSPEMERSIAVLDAAIVIISAVEGIEAHTETVWQLLSKHQIPTFFFVNKIDRAGADIEQVMEQLRKEFSDNVILLSSTENGLELDNEQIEAVAERNEHLLQYYFEQGYDERLWKQALQVMTAKRELFPCFAGSALQNVGIASFLQAFDQLTETTYDEYKPLTGRVYKIRYDKSGTRLTFIKLLSGKLTVRDEINYGIRQAQEQREKVTQLRRYNGASYESVSTACAGELIAVVGLSETHAGDGVGELKEAFHYSMSPALSSSVVFASDVNPKEMLPYFRLLDDEDPSLNVIWSEKLGQIQLHVMGKIQLEVLEQVIRERFSLQISFAPPTILYKETIAASVVGYGHFEPLRHYAEVHLKIDPAPRGAGVSFSSTCHVDELAAASQRLIGQHVMEREHHGLLTGFPLTDVHITLLRGREHNKHTHGGDFREATLRALRQGLEKAENVLLEPYYQFKIVVHTDLIGRVMSDVQRACGVLEPLITAGEKATLTGKAPVATFLDYGTELAAFTQGKGRLQLSFGGYERCHNPEEVIAAIGYDKNADSEYTSASIFCAKGAGYSVPWDEVELLMHIKD